MAVRCLLLIPRPAHERFPPTTHVADWGIAVVRPYKTKWRKTKELVR